MAPRVWLPLSCLARSLKVGVEAGRQRPRQLASDPAAGPEVISAPGSNRS